MPAAVTRIHFAILRDAHNPAAMMRPLAFICYSENMVLGNQLVNRLGDMGYRVQVISKVGEMCSLARSAKPFVIVGEISTRKAGLLPVVKEIRQDEEVCHIPILGFTSEKDQRFHSEAVASGVNLVAMENGILGQLPQLLDMALAVE
jgi:PleD family two-component response regulator